MPHTSSVRTHEAAWATFLGNKDRKLFNGSLLVLAKIIKNIMSSAAESEVSVGIEGDVLSLAALMMLLTGMAGDSKKYHFVARWAGIKFLPNGLISKITTTIGYF